MFFQMRTELRWLPLVACSVLTVSSGLLALLLPETLNKPFPQTLQDVHDLYAPRRTTKDAIVHSPESTIDTPDQASEFIVDDNDDDYSI